MKHLLIILSFLLLYSPLFGQSEETCYVVVDSSEEFNPTLLSNISVSIISQFLREVEPIPPAGVSKDSCLYQISVSKEQDTTFVTFKGKNLNSYGDSKLSGTDGFQQSLLKSLYRSLRDKRKLICEDYGTLLEECGGVVVQDVPKKVEPKVVETKVPTPKTESNLKIEQKVSKTVEGILFKDLFGGWKPVGNKNRPTERKYEGGIRRYLLIPLFKPCFINSKFSSNEGDEPVPRIKLSLCLLAPAFSINSFFSLKLKNWLWAVEPPSTTPEQFSFSISLDA